MNRKERRAAGVRNAKPIKQENWVMLACANLSEEMEEGFARIGCDARLAVPMSAMNSSTQLWEFMSLHDWYIGVREEEAEAAVIHTPLCAQCAQVLFGLTDEGEPAEDDEPTGEIDPTQIDESHVG